MKKLIIASMSKLIFEKIPIKGNNNTKLKKLNRENFNILYNFVMMH